MPSRITVNVTVKDTEFGNEDVSSFRINIAPLKPLDCDLIAQDLCYWHEVTYKIYENRRASVIGTFGSPYLTKICEGFQLYYVITDGKIKLFLLFLCQVCNLF